MRTYKLVGSLIAAALALSACSGVSKDPARASTGEALVASRCTQCHSLDRINGARYDAQQWGDVVDRMRRNGLVVSADERQLIIDYLANR
jgi:cytochrome c2